MVYSHACVTALIMKDRIVVKAKMLYVGRSDAFLVKSQSEQRAILAVFSVTDKQACADARIQNLPMRSVIT
jgi:hypothetical protein